MTFARLDNSRGSGLVLSLLSLIVFFILAGTLVASLRSVTRETIYQKQRLVAQSIAEAGVEDAIAKLQADSSWRTGFSQKKVGVGYYTVSLSASVEPTITSTGYGSRLALLGRPAQKIRVTVQPQPIPKMTYGLFTAQDAGGYDIDLNKNTNYVDAYNSETSTSPAAFLSSATVWSNHDLKLTKTNYSIYGNAVYVHNESNVDASHVSGTRTDEGSAAVFLSTAPGGYTTTNDNLTGLSGGAFNTVNRDWSIPLGSTGTLASGVYYLNNVSVKGTLWLDITDGPVVVFLTGDFTADDSLGSSDPMITNPTGVPGNFILYGPLSGGITVTIEMPTSFYGVILGPTITARINSVVYGAIGAKAIILDSDGGLSGVVHQDLSLQRSQLNVVRVKPNTWKLATAGK